MPELASLQSSTWCWMHRPKRMISLRARCRRQMYSIISRNLRRNCSRIRGIRHLIICMICFTTCRPARQSRRICFLHLQVMSVPRMHRNSMHGIRHRHWFWINSILLTRRSTLSSAPQQLKEELVPSKMVHQYLQNHKGDNYGVHSHYQPSVIWFA